MDTYWGKRKLEKKEFFVRTLDKDNLLVEASRVFVGNESVVAFYNDHIMEYAKGVDKSDPDCPRPCESELVAEFVYRNIVGWIKR